MKKIGFLASASYQATLDQCPEFLNEFDLLRARLADLGAELIAADWEDTFVNWKQFDRLIPKACWNYSENPEKFLAFLYSLEAQKVECRNPVQTLIWNMRKNYLAELCARGFNVGALKIVEHKGKLDIVALSAGFRPEDEVVVKPSVSAGARNTIRCKASELTSHSALFNEILSESDLIVQPYFAEIALEGEYSFFFFGGEYSHAIVKKPKAGDFRAHQKFGAQNIKYEPSSSEIAEARVFLSAAPTECAYGRVDVFRRNGKFWLLELELLEPYLYFEHASEESMNRFCRAIVS